MMNIYTSPVVFLDVDGVLNSIHTIRVTANNYTFVDEKHILRLKRILDETGAVVVLSSDWKDGMVDPETRSDLEELRDELLRYGIEITDYTPDDTLFRCRGTEIEMWLQSHPEVSRFVILDDRADIDPNKDRWVQTYYTEGLTDENADDAIRILKTVGDDW